MAVQVQPGLMQLDLIDPGTMSLFGRGEPIGDGTFAGLHRLQLSDRSWLDHQEGWLAGSEELLVALLRAVPWQQHRRRMYERVVDEPRLSVWYPAGVTWPHPVLAGVSALLSARYGRPLERLSMNLYRNGADSVAWHGDRLWRHDPEPPVAIVSLGSPRPFLIRPKGGGPSRSFSLGWGDLLVMGGRCQQEFDHAVPKVSRADVRLSVMYRPRDERWVQRTAATSRAAYPRLAHWQAAGAAGAGSDPVGCGSGIGCRECRGDEIETLLDGGDTPVELCFEAQLEQRLERRSGLQAE